MLLIRSFHYVYSEAMLSQRKVVLCFVRLPVSYHGYQEVKVRFIQPVSVNILIWSIALIIFFFATSLIPALLHQKDTHALDQKVILRVEASIIK